MRILVISIGVLLILGGGAAILRPRESIIPSSGPDPAGEVARPTLDYYSKEGTRKTGYAALFLGLGACAAGFLIKGFKVPEPNDHSA